MQTKQLSNSRWFIIQPALSALADYLKGEVELIEKLNAMHFKPVEVCKDDEPPILPVHQPFDPRVQEVFRNADQVLRECDRPVIADHILKCYHNDRKQTLEYVKALLIDLKPQEAIDKRELGIKNPQSGDGPIRGDSFYWKGVPYDGLSPRPWRLLKKLWEAEGQALEIDNTLTKYVWKNRAVGVSNQIIGTTLKGVNKFFKQHEIPIKASIKGTSIFLKDAPLEITKGGKSHGV